MPYDRIARLRFPDGLAPVGSVSRTSLEGGPSGLPGVMTARPASGDGPRDGAFRQAPGARRHSRNSLWPASRSVCSSRLASDRGARAMPTDATGLDVAAHVESGGFRSVRAKTQPVPARIAMIRKISAYPVAIAPSCAC
jgi:hypothetical protein